MTIAAFVRYVLIAGFTLVADASRVSAEQWLGTVDAGDWALYRDRFMEPNGRIVDDANGRISHSEGQGYGLLLSYSAGDRAAFEQIWAFTLQELMIRDDGLVAWRWNPATDPHVDDINNASDGDILIAYALALAGEAWNEDRYRHAARSITMAIGRNLLVDAGNRPVLLPAVDGFTARHRQDGMTVVNLSYWVFESLPVLYDMAPDYPWEAVARSGSELIGEARFSSAELPPDWLAIDADNLKPASGFPVEYGYNAIRIPLYLLRAGAADGPLLAPFRELAMSGGIAIVNLQSGNVVKQLNDQGYRMLDAAIACAAGEPVPQDLRRFEPTNYYPSTLYLLSMAYVKKRRPQCL